MLPGHSHQVQAALAPVNQLSPAPARESSLRSSSLHHVHWSLRKYFAVLHPSPVASVTRSDVAAPVNSIATEHGKIAAKRARAHLSSFFTWCLKEGIGGEANPVANTNDPAPDEMPPRSCTGTA
jgi:hypothetical protein